MRQRIIRRMLHFRLRLRLLGLHSLGNHRQQFGILSNDPVVAGHREHMALAQLPKRPARSLGS
ncbi:hypothetical protein GCM10023115_24020 [Pontixanthobacter gangjinensis]